VRRAAIVCLVSLIIGGCPAPRQTKIVVPYQAPVGQQPPEGSIVSDFTLPDVDGKPVSLADTLKSHKSVAVVFYRGFW
jgi:hypothetical protein